jgi:hypothetical protein
MSEPSSSAFSWSGTLQITNIRTLYERCQRLRLTGLMRLKQGDSVLDLMWVGGEPIENEGDQGTRSLPLWNTGEFSVEQRLPDWKGQLTTSVEMTGPMRAGQAQAIYKLCADNVLSADVDLKRGNGEAAQVRFTLGKAEAASINGQSESALAALSKLGAWTDGTFRVALRPLFEGNAAEAPVFDKKASSDDKFDLTGSVNVDISKGPVDWPPQLRDAAGIGLPVPMDASVKPTPVPAAAPSKPPAAAAAPGIPPRLASTLVTGQKPQVPLNLPPASSNAATVPMTSISRAQAEALMKPTAKLESPKKSSRTLQTVGIVFFLIVLLCAGVFLGFFLVRPR